MGQPNVRYESGQTPQAFEQMANSGDNKKFSASFAPISLASNSGFILALYGLQTGGVVTPGSGNDEVAVAASTVVAPGMTGADADGIVTVSAVSDLAIARGLTTDTHRITAVVVTAGSYAAVNGVDGAGFVTDLGAAGGPPYIPEGSVLVAHVKVTSIASAVVLANEIEQVPGTSQETSSFPVANAIDYAYGTVEFSTAIPAIHTGDVPRRVYIKGSTPVFTDIGFTSDWSPAKQSYSTSSTDTYDGALAEATASLSPATFSALLPNGINEDITSREGQELWVEYRHDRDKLIPRQLTQGKLASTWTRAASSTRVPAAFTVAASQATTNVTS